MSGKDPDKSQEKPVPVPRQPLSDLAPAEVSDTSMRTCSLGRPVVSSLVLETCPAMST